MRRLIRPYCAIAMGFLLVLAAPVVQPSGASTQLGHFTTLATAGVTTGFGASSSPRHITTGPDGLQWFVAADSVNRINADGTVTSYDASGIFGANPSLNSIVTGPDGNLWFTKFNPPGQIGKITPSGTMTAVTSFTTGNVEDIINGPDGNLWYTKPFDAPGGGVIGRITPAGATTEFTPPNDSAQPRYMTVAPDGNIWYTDDGGATNVGSIFKSTPTGTITLVAQAGVTPGLAAGYFPFPITTGPDGNIWTAMTKASTGVVARVTLAGVVTPYTTTGMAVLADIKPGCGSLWVSQQADDLSTPSIWQVTTSGALTQFTSGLPAAATPGGISFGPDNDLKITSAGAPGLILNMGTGCATAPPSTTTTTTTAAPPAAAKAVAAIPAFTG